MLAATQKALPGIVGSNGSNYRSARGSRPRNRYKLVTNIFYDGAGPLQRMLYPSSYTLLRNIISYT